MLVDTGVDITVIAIKDWPSAWPMTTPTGRLVGVGGMSSTFQSATMLTIKTQEGTTCTVCPYITNIPISLMGQDVMGQYKFTISSPENFQ